MTDDRLGREIEAIQRRVHALEISNASSEADRRHFDKRFDKLESNLSRLGWLVLGGLAAALVKFIAEGGLNAP